MILSCKLRVQPGTLIPRIAASMVLAVVLIAGYSSQAAAQWATNANNINNTNTGNVGIGTNAPNEQLEITGNFRLPATTAAVGTIKIGSERLIHSFGVNNFFAGRLAGNFSLTGTENTGAGVSSLKAVNGQSHNTAFGFASLGSLNTGVYTQNTALGAWALTSLTNGGQNTALGFGAMNAAPTGGLNTGVGAYALAQTTGNGNTQVGTNTNYTAPNTTGSYNTFIGLNAGYTSNSANMNTTGSNNTFVGAFAGPGTPTQLTNATAIGHNALVTSSNSLVLGGTGTDSVNVGIGTTSPTYKLDVAGEIRSSLGGFRFPDGTLQTTAAVASGGTISGITAGSGLSGGGSSGAVTLDITTGTGLSVVSDSISVNYGSTPGTAVEGNKAITITTNTDSGLAGGGSLTLGSGGTLTLANNDRGSSQFIFKNVANAIGTTQFSAGTNSDSIRFAGTGGTSVTFNAADKKITVDSSSIVSSQWNPNGSSNIDYTAGNVGVGTSSLTPGYRLDVNGNTKVNGNINLTGTGNITAEGTIEAGNIKAKYQDVAEWVPSTHAIPAGTVVTLDPTKSNHVEASSRAYDTRVAGVVSGIALGEGGEGKVLVATTGRVRIKVDASHGPIEVGDLLVTSNVPGVAMRSKPIDVGGVEIHRPGTLIGKALEPLAKGQAEILVLLSLQ